MKKVVEFILANHTKFQYEKDGFHANLEYKDDDGCWIKTRTLGFIINQPLRLTPEAEFIPFDYSDDLLGMKIVSKDGTVKQIITNAYKKSVYCGDYEMDYQDLFDDYIQLNGKPCGKSKV